MTFVPPSYSQVYKTIQSLPSSVGVLAHEGEKVYSEKFDLITIRELIRPNEVWQANHTLLDIEIIDTKGIPKRPWVTIIMDDYSRTIAGYSVSFDSPSAIHTALTLHQVIWTKRDSNGLFVVYQNTFIQTMGVTSLQITWNKLRSI